MFQFVPDIFIWKEKIMRIKYRLNKLICIVLMATLCLSLCGCSLRKKDDGKLKIVTTLFPQYDFARQIVGDKGNVELLLSPGLEAHSYDPTPSDIVEINECDIFIYTGDNMEVWAEDILGSLEKKINILDVSEGIELIKMDEEHNHVDEDEHDTDSEEAGEAEHDETEENHDSHNHVYDPHIWTSPVIAKQMVQNILEEIVKVDPENEDYYRENAEKYIKDLEELDEDFRELINEADIKTIYFADKFAMYYFVEEYGLEYVSAYDSCSSETEPSAKLVAKMVDEVKENDVKAIYYAELSNHKAANTISKETGTEKLLLHSCHNVSKDEFNQGVTYLSLMKQNLENLKIGLIK